MIPVGIGVIIGQMRVQMREHAIKQPLKTSGDSTVPHLLVVDDDLDLCEVLESYLRAEDFAVCFAHSGAEGTKAGIDGAFELIILDVMLPDKKGFDVLRDIRRRARTPVLDR